MPRGFEDKVAFVWRVADKLRGHFKPHEYGSVMLPLLVVRRLDCVLAPTKDKVVVQAAELESKPEQARAALLKRSAHHEFYNASPLDFQGVLADPDHVAAAFRTYMRGFSAEAQEVLDAYRLEGAITRMDKAGILYAVLADFADLNLRPQAVSNEAMGAIFEELLRKFSEMSNETAGEHYTPREIIRLMVELLIASDRDALTGPAPVRTVYDPAAGTGGMLTIAEERIRELNGNAKVEVYGQELNPETWAIARSDLMILNKAPDRMVLGNSLTGEDGWKGQRFDYILANPPYGVDWKAYADPIRKEHEQQEFTGRYGAGLPRVSDGSLLFLQHMLSKMKPVADDPGTPWIDGGSRVAIVLSGSPLFSGAAGGGESEIRRWIIENDWLDGIVALPNQMFYNTGISTYVWILTNRKPLEQRGTVVLVDARELGTKMRKSLGDKRKELKPDAIQAIAELYDRALELDSNRDDNPHADKRVKVIRNEQFGFQRITVERPLRRRWEAADGDTGTIAAALADKAVANLVEDERELLGKALARMVGDASLTQAGFEKRLGQTCVEIGLLLDLKTRKAVVAACAVPDLDAPVIANRKGDPEPDPDLRDAENVPLPEGFLALDFDDQAKVLVESGEEYLGAEVAPYVPDAWIDHSKTKIGYEIPFTRQFYVYTPPRPVAEIDAELLAIEEQIQQWMTGLAR